MKFLQNYPFSDPAVTLVEGFSAYDGVIGDEPGAPHNGVDYVLRRDGECVPFNVYAMHDGVALRGRSDSWGNFVLLHGSPNNGVRWSTVYAHLGEEDESIPLMNKVVEGETIKGIQPPMGLRVRPGHWLGLAGTTGATHGIVQLHLELHRKELATQKHSRLDPYGVNDRASSGRYPQPGAPLVALNHYWASDLPPLTQAD